jgi:hypothetical protein
LCNHRTAQKDGDTKGPQGLVDLRAALNHHPQGWERMHFVPTAVGTMPYSTSHIAPRRFALQDRRTAAAPSNFSLRVYSIGAVSRAPVNAHASLLNVDSGFGRTYRRVGTVY